jgi:hypothetical protein
MTDDKIERGAAEDGAGAPVTPTDVDASRTPPSQSSDPEVRRLQEEAQGTVDDHESPGR